MCAYRKSNLQQYVLLMPLCLHPYVNPWHASIQNDVAHKRRILKMILHANDGPQRAALHEFDLVGLVQVPVLLLEIRVDVPRVPLLGFIDKRLKKVPAGCALRATRIGLGGSQRFRSSLLVIQTGHAARLRINLHPDEFIF